MPLVRPEPTIPHKIVNTFYPSVFTCVLGTQKNLLIEMALLSTHIICFGKLIFNDTLLSRSLEIVH